MDTKKYRYSCDICDKNNGISTNYFGYNSWYGYCDDPKCKELADEKLSERLHEGIGTGNDPLDWCNDSEIDLII